MNFFDQSCYLYYYIGISMIYKSVNTMQFSYTLKKRMDNLQVNLSLHFVVNAYLLTCFVRFQKSSRLANVYELFLAKNHHFIIIIFNPLTFNMKESFIFNTESYSLVFKLTGSTIHSSPYFLCVRTRK